MDASAKWAGIGSLITAGGVILLIIANTAGGGPQSGAAAMLPGSDTIEARARDSVEVMALAGDSIPPKDDLLRLEFKAHRRRFSIPHEKAHAAYVDIMLDSVAARVARGSDGMLAARHDLLFIDGPFTPKQDGRREALARRIARAEAAAAERQIAEAGRARVDGIRAMKQGNCTPTRAAVQSRLRKHPEWSDDMIALTACRMSESG